MNTTHRSVSAAVAVVEVSFIPAPWPVKVPLFLLGWYAGAAPDFDSKTASPSNELWAITRCISWLVRRLSFAVQVLTGDGATARQPKGVHRKFSHTIEGCMLAGLLVWYAVAAVPVLAPWAFWFGLVFATCAWSHSALGDLFTPHGVPLSLLANLVITKGRNPWRDNHPPRWVPRATTNQPAEHRVFMGIVRVGSVLAVVVALRLPVTLELLGLTACIGLAWHLMVTKGRIGAMR